MEKLFEDTQNTLIELWGKAKKCLDGERKKYRDSVLSGYPNHLIVIRFVELLEERFVNTQKIIARRSISGKKLTRTTILSVKVKKENIDLILTFFDVVFKDYTSDDDDDREVAGLESFLERFDLVLMQGEGGGWTIMKKIESNPHLQAQPK